MLRISLRSMIILCKSNDTKKGKGASMFSKFTPLQHLKSLKFIELLLTDVIYSRNPHKTTCFYTNLEAGISLLEAPKQEPQKGFNWDGSYIMDFMLSGFNIYG